MSVKKPEKLSAHWSVRWLHRVWITFAIMMIIMAILFSAFRAFTPWAIKYKPTIEHQLTVLLKQPVHIDSVATSWYWFQPVLKLNQVSLIDDKKRELTIHKLLVGINLFSSLWHWKIQPGILYVKGVHLNASQSTSGWELAGVRQDNSTPADPDAALNVLGWLFAQQKIIIKEVSADIHLKDGKTLPIDSFNLMINNQSGHYRLKGEAALDQETPTEISLLADLKLNPYALKQITGNVYLSLRHFQPAEWMSLFPQAPFILTDGRGRAELWVDLIKGHLDNVHSIISFRNLAWKNNSDFDANHSVINEGWQKWSIFKQTAVQSLENKPPLVESREADVSHNSAHRSHANDQVHRIQSIKANLRWRDTHKGWELTGDKIKLLLDNVHWPENELSLRYQNDTDTYRIFVKTLLIEPLLKIVKQWPDALQPYLKMHPQGELCQTQVGLKDSKINYFLTRFVNVGWKKSNKLPGVKRLSGVLHWEPTEGRLEIDAEQTVFTWQSKPPLIFAQVNMGVNWKSLSHGLRVSLDHLVMGRSDLVFSAKGVIDEPMTPLANIRLTGEFSADNAQRWLSYLPSEHIKPKLDAWLKAAIKKIGKASGRFTLIGALADFPFDNKQGEFSIDTRLTDVDLLFKPQWPLSRNIDGNLRINGRELEADIFHADLQEVPIEAMNLRVDDLGHDRETLLIHGKLKAPGNKIMAYVFNSPLKEHLLRLKQLEPQGDLGVNLRLEVPLYPENDDVIVEGAVHFENNKLIIHHQLNDITLNELNGDLPFNEHGVVKGDLTATLWDEPVSIHTQAILKPEPLTEIDVLGNAGIDSLKKELNWPLLSVMKGQCKIKASLLLTDNPSDYDHLKLSTNLQGVSIDLPPPLKKSQLTSTPLFVDIGFNAENAIKLGIHYKGMTVKANKVAEGDWFLSLQQTSLGANLRYQSPSNTLSGTIERFYLDPAVFKNAESNATFQIKPKQIPHLMLTINDFKWGEVNVGQVTINSTSTDTTWKLDQGIVKTPSYQLNVKGDWLVDGQNSKTTFEGQLHIDHLADALSRWQITPAVEAKKGEVQLKGSWLGGPTQFSLSKLNGEMYIHLKDGRITDLSPETEEKLGLGKLLSILSLQTIPRRLKLDFSDLSQKGYSFDIFEGRFKLTNGVMNTTDSYIDGPVAYANMKGDLDLVHQLYDLTLHISPHITASLPIVATIAGGPIAGIATWVASKIINQGVQHISGYSYKVSGPWNSPIVQQMNIIRKKRPSNS